MIRNRLNWIRGMTGGLALLAALAGSVLPAGLMPKVAGRCGRVLCSCEPEIEFAPCNTCHSHSAQHCKMKSPLTLVTTTISGVDAPGLAFQVVFSGLLAPHKTPFAHMSENVERTAPESAAFALSTASFDIVTPPPKA